MTTLSQLPASLNFSSVAGNPATLNYTFTLTDSTGATIPWASVTQYAIVITDQFGNPITGTAPTLTSPSAYQISAAWTAAQTTLLSQAQAPRFALELWISSVGPYTLTAGLLTMTPPEYPSSP